MLSIIYSIYKKELLSITLMRPHYSSGKSRDRVGHDALWPSLSLHQALYQCDQIVTTMITWQFKIFHKYSHTGRCPKKCNRPLQWRYYTKKYFYLRKIIPLPFRCFPLSSNPWVISWPITIPIEPKLNERMTHETRFKV